MAKRQYRRCLPHPLKCALPLRGIDVPALDAVIFMTPKNSHVDIVQAVGRVMRKAPGKQYGYIILPVAIPPGTDPADALDNNERFAAVWNVLRALRSHDDRLNAEINKIDLNKAPTDRILFPSVGGDGDEDEGALQQLISFGLAQIPPQDIYAKIVERCGDRKYWESWAKDVADIFQRVVVRIENLLDNPDNDALREWFDSFHAELQSSINPSVTRNDAIDMMAQHLLTRPVFEALFENYDFASGNPVSIALDSLRNDFGEFGLENETRDLKGFYESVRMRARGIDNSEGRQRVLLELYENFFANALKKDAERLGIVYTPVEVVDFISCTVPMKCCARSSAEASATRVCMCLIHSPVQVFFLPACFNLTSSKRLILKGNTGRSYTQTKLSCLLTTSQRSISKKPTAVSVAKTAATSRSTASY